MLAPNHCKVIPSLNLQHAVVAMMIFAAIWWLRTISRALQLHNDLNKPTAPVCLVDIRLCQDGEAPRSPSRGCQLEKCVCPLGSPSCCIGNWALPKKQHMLVFEPTSPRTSNNQMTHGKKVKATMTNKHLGRNSSHH